MPERKKPSSSARDSQRARGSASRTTRSGAAKTSKAAAPKRKTAAAGRGSTRKPAAPVKRARTAKPVDDRELELYPESAASDATAIGAGVEPLEKPDRAPGGSRAAVAVGESATGEAAAFVYEPTEGGSDQGDGGVISPDDTPGEVERHPEDIPILVLSVLLAASPFLPWYKIGVGVGSSSASGWETGTWGPMITFLGLMSAALVVLRRANVRVGLPVSDSHIHEGVGWLSLVGAVIKFRAVPAIPPTANGTWGIWVAIGLAFILAFTAGRMSSSSPLVMLPGWFRGTAGKIGIALLGVTIAGAVAFGITNTVSTPGSKPGAKPPGASNVIANRFPKCAAKFPRPSDAKPRQGVEPTGRTPCVFTFESSRTTASLIKFYKAELTKAGFTYQVVPSRSPEFGEALTLSAPTCGQMSISRTQGATATTVIVVTGGQCPTSRPTSGSPKPTASAS